MFLDGKISILSVLFFLSFQVSVSWQRIGRFEGFVEVDTQIIQDQHWSNNVKVPKALLEALDHLLVTYDWKESIIFDSESATTTHELYPLSGHMKGFHYIDTNNITVSYRKPNGASYNVVPLEFYQNIYLIFEQFINDQNKDQHSIVLTKDIDGTLFINTHVSKRMDRTPSLSNSNIPSTTIHRVKMVSYNIWNTNGSWRKRAIDICNQIKDTNPEIIGLQEVRYDFTHEIFNIRRQAGVMNIEDKNELKLIPPSRWQHEDFLDLLTWRCQAWGWPPCSKEAQNRIYDSISQRWFHTWAPAMTYLELHQRRWHITEGLSLFVSANDWSVLEHGEEFIPKDSEDREDAHQRKLQWATLEKRDSYEIINRNSELSETWCLRLTVINTHWPLTQQGRLRAAEKLWELSCSLPLPQIVMGDLNAEPDDPSLASLFSKSECTGKEIDGDNRFRDAHLEFHAREGNEDPGHTFPSWDPVKRIDYFLIRGKQISIENLEKVGISPSEKEAISDHCGLAVSLLLGKTQIS